MAKRKREGANPFVSYGADADKEVAFQSPDLICYHIGRYRFRCDDRWTGKKFTGRSLRIAIKKVDHARAKFLHQASRGQAAKRAR